ncbi:MAG: hypothetical protein IJP23_06675 [Oscillospiraceae bacterium]|nr:hypothetical protein [Oscillospiraceae bacterium]
MKKWVKAVIIVAVLVVLAAAAVGVMYKLYRAGNPAMHTLKEKVYNVLYIMQTEKFDGGTEGIEGDYTSLWYENGQPANDDRNMKKADVKQVIEHSGGTRLINYPKGYYVDMPAGTEFDFTLAPLYVTAEGDGFTAVISREWSTESDVDYYINHYQNRFAVNEAYLAANGLTLLEESSPDGGPKKVTVLIENLADGYDTYTYAFVQTGTQVYFRMMFKYNFENYEEMSADIDAAVESFKSFSPVGTDHSGFAAFPVLPDNWTDDTRAVYDSLMNTDSIYWGVFCSDIYNAGINKSLPELENALDFDFKIVLAYKHFGDEFPVDFMRRCYDDGKLTELTYQITSNNNEDMYAATPMLDIYRGLLDEDIREFARGAREFGKPFFFRLNNEMNSDWTSYSGIINMSDPDIYKAVWQRIYRIFEQEGATNAIWVFNPNNDSYPPSDWNSFLAYYPGDEYVQVIGVTGYNTGTYYADVTGESWKGFVQIYDRIENSYGEYFGAFPWMITEFASSSVGGDKAEWIAEMFDNLKNYPNIKAAVWFDSADYDPSSPGKVSRPYWIMETPETTAAMKAGLSEYKDTKW